MSPTPSSDARLLALSRAVPPSALRILVVGCGAGNLADLLQQQRRERSIWRVELAPDSAAGAAGLGEELFVLDVEKGDPPVEPGSLDCIVYGPALGPLQAPEIVWRSHHRLLNATGSILGLVPNAQHHSRVAALLRGDFPGAALPADVPRTLPYTYATFTRLLLDAGFAPTIVGAVERPCPPEFLAAAVPLLRCLGLHPARSQRYLNVSHYVFRGDPFPDPGGAASGPNDQGPAEAPLSFVACVSDEQVVCDNLLSSPCLGPGSPHEVLLVRGCDSAAEGLNQGLARARHGLVVCAHQDVYLPRGWPQRFLRQVRLAERYFGPVAVFGVYGVRRAGQAVVRAGYVVDRDRLLREPPALPAVVDTLDELLLAMPKDTPLRFEPGLGFHLYGADLCLAARQRGLAAVAVDALCFHNSQTADLPASFRASAAAFARKWREHLPVATSCALIDANGYRE